MSSRATVVKRLYYPGLSPDCVEDDPSIREQSLDFVDPLTLSACLATSKSFCLDPGLDEYRRSGETYLIEMLRQAVWRRYLRGWIERDLCASERWVTTRLRNLDLGDVAKTAFVDALRLYIFKAGLALLPWSGNWDNDKVCVCVAGSYPLYSWMTKKECLQGRPWLDWTPNDVDIYVVSSSADDDDAARSVYDEVVSLWCERFRKQILKEEDLPENLDEFAVDVGTYAEMIRRRRERQRLGETAFTQLDRPRAERDDVRDGVRRRRDFDILAIRDFGIKRAMLLNRAMLRRESITLPVFSFIRWRDQRRDTRPCLDRVLNAFDINVCQVGIEPRREVDPSLIPWTIDDDNDLHLRPLSANVATAIMSHTASVLQHFTPATTRRIEKYTDRGFAFPFNQLLATAHGTPATNPPRNMSIDDDPTDDSDDDLI